MTTDPNSPSHHKSINTWILVCDGAKGRIFLNSGPGKGLSAVNRAQYQSDHAKTSDIGSERPGRTHERANSARHAMEPRVDWHEFEKKEFAKSLAGILDKAAGENAFDRLVLVAPPKTLGELRTCLGAQAAKRIHGEIGKDLTQMAEHELQPYLEAAGGIV